MNPIFAWIIGDTTARSMVEVTRRCTRWWQTQAVAFTRTSGARFNVRPHIIWVKQE